MKTYKTVFFDLDHTLWDFNLNCAETLQELYTIYELAQFGFSVPDFQKTYRHINDSMWAGFHRNEVTKEELRTERFPRTFQMLGIHADNVPARIDTHFIELCPTKPHVHVNSFEILDYLKEKGYSLHIITNGFSETQHVKMKHSGLEKYFDSLIHADHTGYKKPEPQIFEYALQTTGSAAETSIMIGDDLYADVLGAKLMGIGNVFYNPEKKTHTEDIQFEITNLIELKHIL
ncbi:YjjG family noncanonical pyrimidine nucleotidase [Cytophaga hutchinsonii]|uniref:Probable haloacid dehalogenase-like hydrolase n=1 Tax=Cytophaga hutchinsonii (strain ATCC 33406 / DSM 1761 / CIP 103989 / NBRC 15051 / NCIMB 9469 / D465) TaxID=269798 RepID=A0A6N4SNX9_CYTH3|nr:YjjG family noncanonical pyrimidine nucleotidase [Cytophaga hutchinsonii]ABG57991.1 probable haloacid dehalogenase-like hydrolase [Cytophaga hutchinsonii ATCC 33406]SFX10855.1 putative hydrolase of the HAD superfamily [Cytophaga hutchinsonii ATCC 33406]